MTTDQPTIDTRREFQRQTSRFITRTASAMLGIATALLLLAIWTRWHWQMFATAALPLLLCLYLAAEHDRVVAAALEDFDRRYPDAKWTR